MTDNALDLYRTVLPLLYRSTDGHTILTELNARLCALVYYDFLNFSVQDFEVHPGQINLGFDRWIGLKETTDTPEVVLRQSEEDELSRFEQRSKHGHDRGIELWLKDCPDDTELDVFKIESNDYPKVRAEFFRSVRKGKFKESEQAVFAELRHDILSLIRAYAYQVHYSEGYQYFSTCAKISSQLARDYDLSHAEMKLIPDILFGYNNTALAERHFVSVNTIKSHIAHILKKTNTKNRVDFLGRFFEVARQIH
jgi:DNA-binding CsgD family transcriptional regulator